MCVCIWHKISLDNLYTFSKSSRPVQETTLPPIQWVPGLIPWDKNAGTRSAPPTHIHCRGVGKSGNILPFLLYTSVSHHVKFLLFRLISTNITLIPPNPVQRSTATLSKNSENAQLTGHYGLFGQTARLKQVISKRPVLFQCGARHIMCRPTYVLLLPET
jgi:hypothetical protein